MSFVLHRPWRTLICLLALSGAGCTALQSGPALRRTVALPCDVATAIASAALAEALAVTAPGPGGAAAADDLGEAGRRVHFVGNDRAGWHAGSRGRIRLHCREQGALQVVWHDAEAARDSQVSGERAMEYPEEHSVELRIAPHQAGTQLALHAPAALLRALQARLDRAMQLASNPQLAAPGLTETNLTAWRLVQLMTAARERSATSPEGAAELLRQAARMPEAPACVHAQLAAIAVTDGDPMRAVTGYRRAALLARDPQWRATWARAAGKLTPGRRDAIGLRAVALDRLDSGEPATAETLLHSARRAVRDPALDYELLQRVHLQRGDELAALAAGLLAREFAVADAPANAWHEHLAAAPAK